MATRWLPAALALSGTFSHRRAKIGNYAQILRMIRNIVHPFRFINDFPGKRVTERYFSFSLEIFEVVSGALSNYAAAAVTAESPSAESR